MVAIAGILGTLISTLIQNSATVFDFLYCSNATVYNALNIPYYTFDKDYGVFPSDAAANYKGTTQSSVWLANYASVASTNARGITSNVKVPCVYWHGESYPSSSIYERDPLASGNLVRDSAYLAEPLGGWLAVLANNNSQLVNATTLLMFQKWQHNTWYLVSYDPATVSAADIGTKPKKTDLTPLQFLAMSSPGPFVSPQSTATGILGTIPTRYWASLTTLNLSPVPYFNFTSGSTDSSLDDEIANSLNGIVLGIAKIDKTDLRSSNMTLQNAVYAKAAAVTAGLTHGAVYFTKINHAAKQYEFNLHVGSDLHLSGLQTWPAAGARMLRLLTNLNNGFLRNGNVAGLGNAQITQGFRILPQVQNNAISFNAAGNIGVILFPFGVSFLLPIFALVLVQEKEQRILIMMKMNGMKSWAYYLSHYVVFTVLYWASMFIFWMAGLVFKLTLFTLTDKSVLLLLLFVWGNNLISLAFLFASFFSRTRFALVIIFLIVLCSVIISLALVQIFNLVQIPETFFIWPPFAFYRALGDLNQASYTISLQPYRMSMLVRGNEVFTCLVYMVVEVPITLLLAFYFEVTLPSEFGVRLPWHFPVTEPIRWYKRRQLAKKYGGEEQQEREMAVAVTIDENETKFEDSDVKEERRRVLAADLKDADYPLLMRNMRKVYAGRGGQGPKLAVKDVTFAVESGIIFGLLGPNGAGKTTLISILTGLYEASVGDAKIAGFNVKSESREVYKRIGICPQFDIQWEDLTVGEHLYFYSRLKGIKAADEQRAVREALANVSLTAFENRLTKGLSGGERRRVSIAIALLGNPAVVFFDEPTTGLDPEVRRLIWNIVDNSKAGRTIVLTTHSMEEAEALCQRIGIMAKGTLRCYANPTRLKQLYGTGFKIYLNTLSEDTARACAFIESILPPGWSKVDSFATNTSYEFPAKSGVLSKVFRVVEEGKSRHGILDWGIGETTLEEVFIRLISEGDASAEY
ncbi:hypothetical protein HDV03_001251 [Kappamyces sp. JEL0829]|nr:hypothetical protein HDV03_001251 [Kappamyces sp. JEL0829]